MTRDTRGVSSVIRILRKNGWSISAIARRIRVSKRTVYRYEAEDAFPKSAYVLTALEELLAEAA